LPCFIPLNAPVTVVAVSRPSLPGFNTRDFPA
jgi:hypothetical protein